MRIDPKDRVIVIAGASSGIGAATAIECGKMGMKVVLAARRIDKLKAVADRVGPSAISIECDVTKDEDVQRLVDQTIEKCGRLDVMFANAGYGLFAPVLETTEQEMRDIFETNFWGTIRCIQKAAPVMQRGGHIVICSSGASEISVPFYGFYAATKAAQDSIGGALRAELTDRGIFVTTVHPVGTKTSFFDVVTEVSREAGHGLNTPAPMVQTPEHVARRIAKCLRRPRPEVWPSNGARFGVAIMTAFPRLCSIVLLKMMRRREGVTT